MPRIEMERNDSPIDTSMAIAGQRCHKMEVRAPEHASISVLLHWLLWNAYIAIIPENENAEPVCYLQWMRKDSVGPYPFSGSSFGD